MTLNRGVIDVLLLLGVVAFYLFDCLLALALKVHPELSWVERGIYTGPSFQMTVLYFIVVVISIFSRKH
jgi:hypothetical protein